MKIGIRMLLLPNTIGKRQKHTSSCYDSYACLCDNNTNDEQRSSITDAQPFLTSSSHPAIRMNFALGFEQRSHAAPHHLLRLTEPPSIYSPASVGRVTYTWLQYSQPLLRRLTF